MALIVSDGYLMKPSMACLFCQTASCSFCRRPFWPTVEVMA